MDIELLEQMRVNKEALEGLALLCDKQKSYIDNTLDPITSGLNALIEDAKRVNAMLQKLKGV